MRLLALPAFDDNYIWSLVDDDGQALFVDPGDAGPVLKVAAEGLRPIGISPLAEPSAVAHAARTRQPQGDS